VDLQTGLENVIAVALKRNSAGLSINVKTHPRVERFFAGLVDGAEPTDVALYNRFWVPENQNLRIYTLPNDKAITGEIVTARGSYRLDQPGAPLSIKGGLGPTVNLSFLRLVGTSEENGVTFYIRGVYRDEGVEEARRGIEAASQAFYTSFLKPISVTVIVSTIPS